MTTADRKLYWDLLETLQWIATRDEGGITLPAIFTAEAVSGAHAPWVLAKYDFTDDSELAAWQADRKSLTVSEADMIGSSQALNYLIQQVRSRRIRMTAIKCGKYRINQVPVPPAELGGLEFRITPDHRLAKVGLWSPWHNTLMWRSPLFLRSDVIRVWPARKKKSAGAFGLILQHLQTIMIPATPLTKADAQRRCLAEVPDAYPAAFKKAWAILDPSCKRGPGKPRGRTH
jgi:hypothetical protein